MAEHVAGGSRPCRGGGTTAVAAGAAGPVLPALCLAPNADGTAQAGAVTGYFPPDALDWYYLPVEVPPGVRELAVAYDYDRPRVPAGVPGNALDIGVFGPAGYGLGDDAGFRGWSGGARDRFNLSASTATPGYLPGPIEPGVWHVVLGPYTVAPQGMDYRVEVTLSLGPPGPPFTPHPAPVFAPQRRRGRDWYRGDCHLHTVHSDGRRTPGELVAAARAAGLDFIVSTEHNTSSVALYWGEHASSDLLIVNGEEVTTRSGHWLALGLPAGRWIDWRYRSGDAEQFRRFVTDVHSVAGLVCAGHPSASCPGCSWDFHGELVDAIEVWNGPWGAENEAAVATWHDMLCSGRWVPALGGSDVHGADDVVGVPHNVVFAEDLFEPFLLQGVKAGRTWISESTGVRLSLEARGPHGTAGIGERLDAGADTPVEVAVEVTGAPGCTALLVTPAGPVHAAPVDGSGTTTVRWTTSPRETPWVRAEVRRPLPTATTADTMVALSNPVFLGRG